ncbi:hypothetical protein T492DRAFT_844924 [Pavlovales sp. CCMP2436]|nr:hypothetical protein T492DRAFT_844924 [Pavlovales sp. CCMP2436]
MPSLVGRTLGRAHEREAWARRERAGKGWSVIVIGIPLVSFAAAVPADSSTPENSDTGEALASAGEARCHGSASGRGRIGLAFAVKAAAELASTAMTKHTSHTRQPRAKRGLGVRARENIVPRPTAGYLITAA